MARSLTRSALRAASHSSRETIACCMVSLLQFWGVGWVSCRGRPGASFSQCDTWKRLINRYIQAMPSIGGMPEAEAQSAVREASVAAIHAIRAKVGDAARPIQRAASRARHAPALRLFAAFSVVTCSLLSDFDRFRPLMTQAS